MTGAGVPGRRKRWDCSDRGRQESRSIIAAEGVSRPWQSRGQVVGVASKVNGSVESSVTSIDEETAAVEPFYSHVTRRTAGRLSSCGEEAPVLSGAEIIVFGSTVRFNLRRTDVFWSNCRLIICTLSIFWT